MVKDDNRHQKLSHIEMTTTYDKVRPNYLQQASGSHEYTYEYIQTGSVEHKNEIF